MIYPLRRYRFGWVALSLAFVLLTGACADITELVTPPPTMIIDDIRDERIPPALPRLIINLGPYPDTLDPQKSAAVFDSETTTLRLIYEGLTRLNEKLETVPGAAESWTYNFDATELTFHLRPDLKYSDGTPLNAKRFEYALIRNINPDIGGEYSSLTDNVLGATEWRNYLCGVLKCTEAELEARDKGAAAVRASVQALDSAGVPCVDYQQASCLTLKIKFAKPAPYFHTIMSMWIAYPAKEESIQDGDENWWNTAQYQVGNGPFRLITVEPFVRQELVPNPYYRGPQPQYYLEIRYVTDPAIALEAYKNDELDIIATDVSQLTAINANDDLKAQHLIYPSSCTVILQYNLASEYFSVGLDRFLVSPFQEKKVREAFSYAFDAEGWATEVDKGLTVPAWTWIPPGYPGHDTEETNWKFDPQKARAALAESSYKGPDGLNALGLRLTFADAPLNWTLSI